MNINVTLIVQMLVFALLVWFTMKFVWPPILKSMEEREKRIADGLAAGEQAAKDLEIAQQQAERIVGEARQQAASIVDQANARASTIVDDAKDSARAEGERLMNSVKSEIEQEYNRARDELRGKVSTIAVASAEKILSREIDDNAHRELLSQLAAEL